MLTVVRQVITSGLEAMGRERVGESLLFPWKCPISYSSGDTKYT